MTERLTERAIDRVDVAVIVALDLEAAPLRERLEGTVRLQARDAAVAIGRLGGRSVAIAVAGMGVVAGHATRTVIDGHRPDLVVAAGICGGLAPDLEPGALVIAERVVHVASAGPGAAAARGDPTFPHPEAMPPAAACVAARGFPAASLGRLAAPARHGVLVTADAVVATPEEKKSLAAATGGIAVDMESWWILEAAREAGVPAAAVRTVSDTAAMAIPADVARLAALPHAMRRVGAAVRLLWRRPGALVDLAELRDQAHRAADTLAARLAELLA